MANIRLKKYQRGRYYDHADAERKHTNYTYKRKVIFTYGVGLISWRKTEKMLRS